MEAVKIYMIINWLQGKKRKSILNFLLYNRTIAKDALMILCLNFVSRAFFLLRVIIKIKVWLFLQKKEK